MGRLAKTDTLDAEDDRPFSPSACVHKHGLFGNLERVHLAELVGRRRGRSSR